MKQLLLVFMFFVTFSGFCQKRIKFEYDSSGNQIKRHVVLTSARVASNDSLIKGVEDLKEEDLQKNSPEDVLSYYPNPVRDELYLKWDLIENNKVLKIEVYAFNGQLIKSFINLEKESTKTIPFNEQPDGTYLVILFYTNNEQKSITLVKQ
ncbi:MAG: T9SS type A sorting domain-containing protein [Flavobacterium sp.]|nr:T9SS type A sorting domain-containing protein [Flavobacterium sp.]